MQNYKAALRDSKLGPVWHDPEIMPEPLPSLAVNESCELLIVGGGFTGLWAALQAKERKPDADIILVEQTFVGDGASGRCGGFIQHYLAHGESNTDHRFPGEAERLEELGIRNFRELLESLERYKIEAHYRPVGSTTIALDPEVAERLHDEYQLEKSAGNNVEWFDREAIREKANSPKFYGGLLDSNGLNGTVDPMRLCLGLKQAALGLGVRIYENTPMQDFTRGNKTGMTARCHGGEINSEKILIATNAFHSKVGRLRRTIVPVWDYQLATEPLTNEQLERIGWHKNRMALSDNVNMFHYFRMTNDNRITWGGGGAIRYYFNNGIDKRYEDSQARYEQLAQEFFEVFPQLSDVRFSHRWGGIIATSTRFCMVPGVIFNGRVAWCVGYTGLGVGASRFGARIGIELLGYKPSDILNMQFVRGKTMPWFPEPFRWLGIRFTNRAMVKADKNGGKRGWWLKLLDKMNLGFAC